MRKQVKPKEPPCTERYARWCERTVGKIITYLLLDFSYMENGVRFKENYAYLGVSMKIRTTLQWMLTTCVALQFASCGSIQQSSTEAMFANKPDSTCQQCDNAIPSYPVITEDGGYGAVTTYGSVVNPQPSLGGACNYGQSNVQNFAAVHVDNIPGDAQGIWNNGHICGQCFQVKVATQLGWKSTIVRIMDKCPDAYCGIDLGGQPAMQLMGNQPGRYSGEWTRVSCSGVENVSDATPTLVTKDGSNAWWSLVQVHNPPSEVIRIQWKNLHNAAQGVFQWATEAENYYKVPDELLSLKDTIILYIDYWTLERDSLRIVGADLGKELQSWNLD